MVNQITTWTHTVVPADQNKQNLFYVKYQISGDNQIQTGSVVEFIDNGNTYRGVKTNNGYYELVNYSYAVNDYYYCFQDTLVNEIAGTVNGRPALKLGGNQLGFLQNLSNVLSFQNPTQTIQATPLATLYSTADQGTTLNQVELTMSNAPIWVQFGSGDYNVTLRDTGFGPIICSPKLMTASGGTDTQLLQPNPIENTLFFTNLNASISTTSTSFDTNNTILPIPNPENLQLFPVNNVFFLSVRNLTILKPYSVFWINQVPYYLIQVGNGGFVNSSNQRVAVLKSIPIVGDGSLFRLGHGPQVYIPCVSDEVPAYVGVKSIPILPMEQIPTWSEWLNEAPVMRNIDPKQRNLITTILGFGANLLRKIFKRS
jgi:hypothetical protein